MCFCKLLQQAWRSIQPSSSLLQNWFIPKAFKTFHNKSPMHVRLFLKHGGLGVKLVVIRVGGPNWFTFMTHFFS